MLHSHNIRENSFHRFHGVLSFEITVETAMFHFTTDFLLILFASTRSDGVSYDSVCTYCIKFTPLSIVTVEK